jgi:hypothetical protein
MQSTAFWDETTCSLVERGLLTFLREKAANFCGVTFQQTARRLGELVRRF